MANLGFISLGCAKNQVDCERMMYRIQEAGHSVQPDVVGCDVVIINTCGFIDAAKSEAIDFILQMGQLKEQGLVGKILVTGCLSQRYQSQIMEEMPEVDGVLGTGSYTEVVSAVDALLAGNAVEEFGSIDAPEQETGRILTTPEHYAYIKIEGYLEEDTNAELLIQGANEQSLTVSYTDRNYPEESFSDKKLMLEEGELYTDCGNPLVYVAREE